MGLLRRPWIGFLGSSFFLILLPTSSVVPILTQVMAEHRMYLPLAAVVTLMVMLGYLGWQRIVGRLPPTPRQQPLVRSLPFVVLGLAAVSLGLQTWLRNLDYRTAFSIWSDTVAKLPLNPRAHFHLVNIYLSDGQIDSAMKHLDRAIELSPSEHPFYFLRGALHLRSQDYEAAIHDYNRLIELRPEHSTAHQNRGLARLRLGQFEQAAQDLTKAMQLGPELVNSYRYRALARAALGKRAEAQLDAREYVRRGGQLDDDLRRLIP